MSIGEADDAAYLSTAESTVSSCSYDQYQLLAMELYNWGSIYYYPNGVKTQWLTSCSSDNPGGYGAAVKQQYSYLISSTSTEPVQWCDWFTSSCSNTYGTSQSWGGLPSKVSDYFYKDATYNNINWNNADLNKTGYDIQGTTYQPWCPSSVIVGISGTAHGDSYQRYLSVNFTDGGSTEQLVKNTIVQSSFNLNYTVSSSYLTTHSTGSAPFYLTTFVGYWNITEIIYYDPASTC